MKKIALILFLVGSVVYISMPAFAQEADMATAAPAGGGDEETDIVAGKVAAIDAANNSLSVTDEAGKSYTVMATKEETSIWKGDDTINLADVKSGDSVELEYYKNKEGKLVAIWVDVLTKEATPPPEVNPETPAPEATTPEPAPAN